MEMDTYNFVQEVFEPEIKNDYYALANYYSPEKMKSLKDFYESKIAAQ